MINSAVHEHLANLSRELGKKLTVTIELDYSPGNPEYHWSYPSTAHSVRISGECEKNPRVMTLDQILQLTVNDFE